MADDHRKIEIEMVTTGGDQSAGEMRKVETAAREQRDAVSALSDEEKRINALKAQFLTAAEAEVAEVDRLVRSRQQAKAATEGEVVSLQRLEQELAEARQAYKTAAIGSEEFLLATRRVEAAEHALAQATHTVSASGLNMRSTISNVGYQVQDFAVQVGMGTSALRAFGQQGPQLLSAFGPWGIIAGTVIALGAPLVAAFTASGDAAAKEKDDVDDLTGVMDAYADATHKAIKEKDAEKLREWFDALDQEEEDIRRNNEALEASVALQIKLNALKGNIEESQRRLAIANIEADPNLTDAQKTRQVAAYQEQIEKRKAQEKIDALGRGAQSAATGYENAQSESDRRAQDFAAATAKREEVQAAAEAEKKRAQIAASIPGLQKQLDEAFATRSRTSLDPASDLTEINRQIADLKERIKAAVEESGGNLTTEERRKRQEKVTADVDNAITKESEKKAEADTAREKAEKAYAEMLRRQAEARESAPFIERQYQVDRQTREVQTESKARAQEQRAAEEAARKAEQEQRAAEARAKRSGSESISNYGLGIDAANEARKLGNTAGADALERQANELINNPGKDANARMLKLIERFMDWAEQQQTDSAGTARIDALERKLTILEARQKNARTGR